MEKHDLYIPHGRCLGGIYFPQKRNAFLQPHIYLETAQTILSYGTGELWGTSRAAQSAITTLLYNYYIATSSEPIRI